MTTIRTLKMFSTVELASELLQRLSEEGSTEYGMVNLRAHLWVMLLAKEEQP